MVFQRKGKLTLDASGNLKGDVSEIRVGDRAWSQRWALRTVTKDSDRIKPIENLLAGSLSSFQITKRRSQTSRSPTCPSALTIPSRRKTTRKMPATCFWSVPE
jgi:hypothetical protein